MDDKRYSDEELAELKDSIEDLLVKFHDAVEKKLDAIRGEADRRRAEAGDDEEAAKCARHLAAVAIWTMPDAIKTVWGAWHDLDGAIRHIHGGEDGPY